MLTTEFLRKMLEGEQNQDEIQVKLTISCSRALAESILQGTCPAITIKLEEDEQ